jgi:hypothetical protein
MRAVAGLPGAIGPPSRLMTILAMVGAFVSMLVLSVLAAPASVWASAASAYSASGSTPSPYPDPSVLQPPGNSPGLPSVPVPVPPSPPSVGASTTTGIAYPQAPAAAQPARADVPAWSRILRATVPPTGNPQQTVAATRTAPIAAPDLDLGRSLVYSGALALAIAGLGLLMLGSRRRLW